MSTETTSSNWFSDLLEESNQSPEAVVYGLMLRIAGQVAKAMAEQELTPASLAAVLGTSTAWVNQLLDADVNLKFADVMSTVMWLGIDIKLVFYRKGKKL